MTLHWPKEISKRHFKTFSGILRNKKWAKLAMKTVMQSKRFEIIQQNVGKCAHNQLTILVSG